MYYKVVTEDLTSLAAYGAADVQYKEGEWVQAPEWLAQRDFHLLVFNDLHWAVQNAGSSSRIFECSVQDIVKLPRYTCHIRKLAEGSAEWSLFSWPAGTAMVKQVRLDREIPEKEWFK